MTTDAEIHQIVRDRYAAAAQRASQSEAASCCGDAGCGQPNPITADLYHEAEVAGLPAQAVLASLGCGNPTALAELKPGETVLDLGSGGGIDVLLSARRVGPTGKAYGLDMTDEMLELANRNKAAAGATNVEFVKGTIESIPLPDASVDVVISNCVINLAADKGRALREAFRVLRPGGRFAVSDTVVRGEMPDQVRQSMQMWAGCLAGALQEQEYLDLLGRAGFTGASIETTRTYTAGDARALPADAQPDRDPAGRADGLFAAAFVRAVKPRAA